MRAAVAGPAAHAPIGKARVGLIERGRELQEAALELSSNAGEAHPEQARLPAGQAGEGDADGAGTGRALVRGMGGSVRGASD
jgi:hypothetical protein